MRQLFSMGALGLINLNDYFSKTYSIILECIKTTDKILLMQIPDGASSEELSEYFNQIK
jgi:hypothetical protein